MTNNLNFMCENCGCEMPFDEEDGRKCHCFWDDDDQQDLEDYDFEEQMGTA